MSNKILVKIKTKEQLLKEGWEYNLKLDKLTNTRNEEEYIITTMMPSLGKVMFLTKKYITRESNYSDGAWLWDRSAFIILKGKLIEHLYGEQD